MNRGSDSVTENQKRRWTEQERTDALEGVCGGPNRTFRLLHHHTASVQTCSGDRFLITPPKRTVESVFERKALDDGYTKEQVAAFLEYN